VRHERMRVASIEVVLRANMAGSVARADVVRQEFDNKKNSVSIRWSGMRDARCVGEWVASGLSDAKSAIRGTPVALRRRFTGEGGGGCGRGRSSAAA
jgi:hypothetical protein